MLRAIPWWAWLVLAGLAVAAGLALLGRPEAPSVGAVSAAAGAAALEAARRRAEEARRQAAEGAAEHEARAAEHEADAKAADGMTSAEASDWLRGGR